MAERRTGCTSDRRIVVAAAVTALLLLVSGCGQIQDRDVCDRVAALQTSVRDLQKTDIRTASPDQLQKLADDALARLNALQAASETPYDQAIANLEEAIMDFQSSVTAAGQQARATAEPLIEDALDTLNKRFHQFTSGIDVTCTTP